MNSQGLKDAETKYIELAHRGSQLETCASIAAARSPSQPWKANMFTVTSPFSPVLWISKKSLSFNIFFVQSRYHNYFHSLIQDINTFQYTWHFLSKHFFILGRHCLDGFQLKNDAFEDIQETYFSKYSFSDPQHSVSAPAHSLVIAPNPATSPQNGISAPVWFWPQTKCLRSFHLVFN